MALPISIDSFSDLKNYHLVSKRYRNRRIGDFLKELKLIEGRNTGIPTILRSLSANGSDYPVFETDEDRSYFTIAIPIHNEFLPTKQIEKSVAPEIKKSKKRRSFEEIKALILETLSKEGPLPTAVLVDKMGYQKLSDSVSNAIKELISEGIIRYEEEKLKSKNQRLMISNYN